jgi:CelD/BcsL family acetyltransferase involved in cellulose biosynthesis
VSSATCAEWRVITDRDAVAKLEGQWRSLEDRWEGGTPFQSFAWCHQWLKHRRKNHTPFILVSADRNIIAPFAMTEGTRVLCLIGTGDSDYLGLVTAMAQRDAWQAVIVALHERRDEWHLLHLHSIRQKDDVLSALSRYKDFTVIERDYEKCPVLMVSGTWEAYLGGRKKVRYETRRWAKRVNEAGAVTVEPLILPLSSELLSEMTEVERESWKWEWGTAAFKPGAQADFISAVLRDSQMPARIWCLRSNGKLVAFAMVLEDKRGWYYYLPSFRSSCPNAGAYLLSCIVEEAFRNGCGFIDLLQGNHGYKSLWSDESVGVTEIVAANSLWGRILLQGYAARWRAAKNNLLCRLRNLIKQVGDRREANHGT